MFKFLTELKMKDEQAYVEYKKVLHEVIGEFMQDSIKHIEKVKNEFERIGMV